MRNLKRLAIFLIIVTGLGLLVTAPYVWGSTRALQFKVFAFGITNPDTGASLDGGVVYFYAAGSGTSTPKNVWTEKAETNPYTSYTLDGDGAALLYGEGEYHILVKDSSANTVYDRDYWRMEYPNFYQHTVAADYTQTSDDDVIFVNTAGGNKEITLLAAASWKWPLTIMNTSTNTVTITPDGSELIDNASSATITTINTAYVLVSTGTAISVKYSIPSSQYMTNLGVNYTYSALIDYAVGDFATGSDYIKYRTLIANGPSTSAVDPVGDATSTWIASYVIPSVANMTVITVTGTYTKPTGLKAIIVEVIGGGGGGGGVAGGGGATFGAAAGGGGGGYSREYILTAALAASETVTIGAGGAGGAAGDNNGFSGGTTSFSSGPVMLQATGGTLATGDTGSGTPTVIAGGNGGVGTLGDVNSHGFKGGYSLSNSTTLLASGRGGGSYLGGGARGIVGTSFGAGVAGVTPGSGGSGGSVGAVSADYAGGAGANGIIIIHEFF